MSDELTRVQVETMCDVIGEVSIDWPVRISMSRSLRDHDAALRAQVAHWKSAYEQAIKHDGRIIARRGTPAPYPLDDDLKEAQMLLTILDTMARECDEFEFGIPESPAMRAPFIRQIVHALDQRERDTWEAAAKMIEDGVDVSYECGPGNWKTFKSSDPKSMAKQCRTQAQEVGHE